MIDFLYNISPVVKDHLENIELSRQKILLTILSPKKERRIRWEASIRRIFCMLSIYRFDVNQSEIAKIIQHPSKSKLPKKYQQAVLLKNTFDYINAEYLAFEKEITVKHIQKLIDKGLQEKIKLPQKDLSQLLDYLTAKPEHPVVQAGIIFIQMYKTMPDDLGWHLAIHIIYVLFLYKTGYDFRGLLNLEEYWFKNQTMVRAKIAQALETSNLTLWLEYFAQSVHIQLAKTAQDVASVSTQTSFSSNTFWNLNERQKEILIALEQPNVNITNKQVQNIFKISQVTASRDLSKLVVLGLLLSHGKGRSVSYTKV